ncbi:MAG: GNAT family N-acetyltransferase [Alphaproteobacteria bacterium]|nr:GNAT family N-acetyltransferase [Alphaproteobacteria bacterium]
MSYEILPDISGDISRWVCRGLNENSEWLGENITFGFAYNNRMVGGLIFHDYTPHRDVWWTIYSCDKHWCNRITLRRMFAVAFEYLDCRRINLLVSESNSHCLDFVQRLGFKKEGLLRHYRENGENCHILGMLREECPWFNFLGEKNE